MKPFSRSTIISLTLFLPLIIPASVSAVDAVPGINTGTEPIRTVTEPSQRCTNATNRITAAITKWNTNNVSKEAIYKNVETRVKSIISELNAKKVDTQALTAALENYDQAVAKRHTDAALSAAALENAKELACNPSPGKYTMLFKTANDQRLLVRKDEVEIQNIWQTQIRPSIVAIRKMLQAATPSGKPENSPSLKVNSGNFERSSGGSMSAPSIEVNRGRNERININKTDANK